MTAVGSPDISWSHKGAKQLIGDKPSQFTTLTFNGKTQAVCVQGETVITLQFYPEDIPAFDPEHPKARVRTIAIRIRRHANDGSEDITGKQTFAVPKDDPPGGLGFVYTTKMDTRPDTPLTIEAWANIPTKIGTRIWKLASYEVAKSQP